MTAAVTQATNLFPYLVAEEQHRDHQAEEVLFLTFNVDLGYFEARLLGLLRATGARITVLADARVWAPDTRAIKHAGRSYQLGLIDQPRAFHPKLMVLVGPKRVVAAVGSGNLTMGGWQYNRELLTVFTGDSDGVPSAVGNIRDALRALPASATDAVTARAVERTIRRLDALFETAPAVETGHRVHASWVEPLVDHLPAGPVAELYLSAAFHDPDAGAVRALLARTQPSRVQVAVQPGWTHVDSAALDQVLAAHAATSGAQVALLRDAESLGTRAPRYRHGKLIEWVTVDGERHAMTGSPNLTTVALLRRGGAGGNHELAVTGPVPGSLFPDGEPVEPADVPVLEGDTDATPTNQMTSSSRVLAAVARDSRVTVHLSRESPVAVAIECAHRSDHPDHWSTLGVVPANSVTATFDAALPAGSRVRAIAIDGAPTTPMFVTDESSVLTRSIPDKRVSKLHSSRPSDLFGDDLELLDLLKHDLATFALEAATARPPVSSGDHDDERVANERGDADPTEPWLWLQDDAVRRFGPDITSWLLALPRLKQDSGAVPWVDVVTDEQAAGLDSDEAAPDVDEKLAAGEVEARTTDLVDHTTDPDRRKAARRRWAAKATAVVPRVPVAARLLVLRATLVLWSAGNWSERDPEPFTLVRNLVRNLNLDDQPAELMQRAASLTAIALTLMRQQTDITVSTEQTVRFNEVRDAARPILPYATEATLDDYVTRLRTSNGAPLTSDHVIETLEDMLGGDPLAELETVMESKGFEIHRPSTSSIHIHKASGNAELSALEAVGFAQEHDGIVVWATTDAGRWACVAWQAPDLVTVFNVGEHERWRHQRLVTTRPASAAAALSNAIRSSDGTAMLPGVVNRRGFQQTPEARAVLISLGVELPQEPPCCRQSR